MILHKTIRQAALIKTYNITPLYVQYFLPLSNVMSQHIVGEFNNIYNYLNEDLPISKAGMTAEEYAKVLSIDQVANNYVLPSNHDEQHKQIQWALANVGGINKWYTPFEKKVCLFYDFLRAEYYQKTNVCVNALYHKILNGLVDFLFFNNPNKLLFGSGGFLFIETHMYADIKVCLYGITTSDVIGNTLQAFFVYLMIAPKIINEVKTNFRNWPWFLKITSVTNENIEI